MLLRAAAHIQVAGALMQDLGKEDGCLLLVLHDT